MKTDRPGRASLYINGQFGAQRERKTLEAHFHVLPEVRNDATAADRQ
jgi:hypothetical protein